MSIEKQPSLAGEPAETEPVIRAIAQDFNFEGDEHARERWRVYAGVLESFVNNEAFFLDHGGTARVYAIGDANFCIKLMENRHDRSDADRFDLGNPVQIEAGFLKRASEIETHGARTPALLDALEGDKYGALVMEQLDAINLQHAFNGDAELPESFDADRFLDALDGFIRELHSSKNILHGDFEARNVMVDRQTGLPRVIDFGRARNMPVDDKARWELESSEWDCFERISGELERHLTESRKAA